MLRQLSPPTAGPSSPSTDLFYAPERFAIDWVQVGKYGRLYDGPEGEALQPPLATGRRYTRWPMDAWSGMRDDQAGETTLPAPDWAPPPIYFGGNYVVVKIAAWA